MYILYESYSGREPGQCFGVIKDKHLRVRRNNLEEQMVEKVSFVNICDVRIPIKTHLRFKNITLIITVRH